MQKLRNDVLNDHFELELNSKLLESGHGRHQLRLDKTYFCEHYESQLLRQSTLTDHQKEKFEELQREKPRLMHVNAVAGSGKTFLAVQLVVDTLKETAGQVLFIAPSLPLCLYFIRWLGRRGSHENISFPSLLDRLVILVPTMNFMKLVVKGREVLSASQTRHFVTLSMIWLWWMKRTTYSRMMFWTAASWRKWIRRDGCCCPTYLSLQSSRRNSRQTWRKWDWHKWFVAPNASLQVQLLFMQRLMTREGLGSLCPDGPPLKTFLFQTTHVAGAEKDYVTYVQKSVAAIHFIVDGYRGLSLHHRVALLVCDDDFRQKFEPML